MLKGPPKLKGAGIADAQRDGEHRHPSPLAMAPATSSALNPRPSLQSPPGLRGCDVILFPPPGLARSLWLRKDAKGGRMEYATAAAIGSNILAAFALAVAYASYRVSRRTESRLQDASEPTVSAKAWPIDSHPKWYRLQITVINHSRYVLEDGTIELNWPLGCRALAWNDATEKAETGGPRKIKERFPLELADRKLKTPLKVQRSGTTNSGGGLGGLIFLGSTDTLNWEIAVYDGLRVPFLGYFLFSVTFVSNLSDRRRFTRHVSRQRIAIPKRQST
jgi:hypothetical protein